MVSAAAAAGDIAGAGGAPFIVIPRHHGGKNTFENMVWCEKGLNSMKGDRRNEEIGLKLIRKPKAPPSMPLSATITEAKHPAWKPFLVSGS